MKKDKVVKIQRNKEEKEWVKGGQNEMQHIKIKARRKTQKEEKGNAENGTKKRWRSQVNTEKKVTKGEQQRKKEDKMEY